MDRKAKVREYKETPRPMGIFSIRNLINGKVLVGSSTDLKAIINRFRSELKMGSCRKSVLQKDWNKFGGENFEFKELEILKPLENPNYDPSEDLQFLLKLWIEKLDSSGEKGYN